MADPVVPPIEPVAATVPAAVAQEPSSSPHVAAAPAADLFGDTVPVSPPSQPTHPAEVPSLLETLGEKKEEPKPVEPPKVEVKADAPAAEAPKPTEEAKPAELDVKPLVEQAVAPVEWKFELPSTLKADDARMTRFTGILDNILVPKEGETRVHAGQRLIDLHNEAMTTYAEQVRADQIKAFNDTRAEWRKQVMADAQIGGAGHQTALGAIARMRDLTISDARPGTPQYDADAKEFNDFLRVTGAGDHPAYLRQLHRFARFLDEPPAPAAIPKPTPTNGIRPNGGLYRNKAQPNGGAR